MNGAAARFPLFFNTFGKSPKELFNNLELIDNAGVFSPGKTPEIGNFLHRRFVSA
jgi:hypothetical protein